MTRHSIAILVAMMLAAPALAQTTRPAPESTRQDVRTAEVQPRRGEPVPDSGGSQEYVAPQRTSIARVTSGNGTVPNDAGQVYSEYDISPYTLRVTSTQRPEQAIVDWILRETGYEAWHSEPFGFLSATNRSLRVYHTPEMQNVVAEIVDRFVSSEAESHSFGVRIVSIANPNWRAKSLRNMQAVSVESPGIQAWLLAKEDAALLVAELRKRSDFREHSAPHILVHNGQSHVVTATRARRYTRDILMRAEAWPAFESDVGQIDEGFTFELSPLLSLDGKVIDAVVKCNIEQVEKMLPVLIDVPAGAAPRQQAKIEVPQVSQCRLQERFRWPADKVLLVGMGVVATPIPVDTSRGWLPLPSIGPPRADLLFFIESKGRVTDPTAAAGTESGNTQNRISRRY